MVDSGCQFVGGPPFMPPQHTVTVTMDASLEGWGRHSQGSGLHSVLFHGLWDSEDRLLHINVLEAGAVRLMLLNLGQTLLSQVIQIESNNTTTVVYINKEGIHSQALNRETMLLYDWAIPMNVQLQAVHWLVVDNILADYVSHNVTVPMEWNLDRTVRCLSPSGTVILFTQRLSLQMPCYNHGQGCLCMFFPHFCCYPRRW